MIYVFFFFFFKQKTAYEMRISDWSSDVCSSDLRQRIATGQVGVGDRQARRPALAPFAREHRQEILAPTRGIRVEAAFAAEPVLQRRQHRRTAARSEEHTSELQSLMRISYAVFCLKKQNITT